MASDSARTVDCLSIRFDTRPSLARSSLTSFSRLGLLVVGLDRRRRRALVEPFGLQPRFQAGIVGFGRAQLLLGVVEQLLRLRVAQLEDDRVRA